MALEIKLSQKLNQQLLMTPQLQQAIKLLQLGRLEYKEAIEKELLENPVLEEKDSNESEGESSSGDGNEDRSSTGDNESDESGNGDKSQDGDSIDWEEQLKNYGEYNGNGVLHGPSEQLERPSLEATLSSRENLASYLISQLQLLELGDTEKKILFQIIGNLDKDGYL